MIRVASLQQHSEKSDPHLLTPQVGVSYKSCLPAATQQGEWPALTLWRGRGDERVASLQQHGEQSDPHLLTQQAGGKWQESCLPTATWGAEWPTLPATAGRGRWQELPPYSNTVRRVTHTDTAGRGRWHQSCLPAATQSDPHLLTLWVGVGDERVASLQQQWKEWPTLTDTAGRGRRPQSCLPAFQQCQESDPHLLTLQVG